MTNNLCHRKLPTETCRSQFYDWHKIRKSPGTNRGNSTFNAKGTYEKWKKSGWLAYTASIREEMFFIRLIDKDANEKLIEKLKKLDAEKGKKDLKDLNI